jgi:hypothetical protein
MVDQLLRDEGYDVRVVRTGRHSRSAPSADLRVRKGQRTMLAVVLDERWNEENTSESSAA